jgi:2-haloalkanoic acid dehalogenase type II
VSVSRRRFEAVLFDLLTALLDSWTLWDRIAGGQADGRRWRAAYLQRTYQTGGYRPYETLVAEAAAEIGLPPILTAQLAARYGELEPWPEVRSVLGTLREQGLALGVVTNCSEALGTRAIACTCISFDVVVTAERAGFYKPDPRPYRLALDELGMAAGRCLFVAGSAYDLFGTQAVGLPTYWHNRLGIAASPDTPEPMAEYSSLNPLLGVVTG